MRSVLEDHFNKARVRALEHHEHFCGSHNPCPVALPQVFSQLTTAIVSRPMERFFTRRAGPPTSAWPQRHAEEDFLAVMRHNAATKLEMEQWPQRRAGRHLPEDLPQANRPD